MLQKTLTVQNKLGIHARAAAKLVDTAKKFGSKIELIFRGRSIDCKSIMGVITLGAQKDNELEIIITGEDEAEALAAIEKLFNGKFGEE
jgi:phosphocarrier protein